MRKTLLLLFAFISVFGYGQINDLKSSGQLVVEIKTDNFASETSWKLFDVEGNVILEKNSFEAGTVSRDTIDLDMALCYYWTIYDSHGDGMSYASGLGVGYYNLYLDNNLIIQSTEANFGYQKTEYGIGSTCASNEVAVSVLSSPVLSLGKNSFKMRVLNMGTETINTIEWRYKIDEELSSVAKSENLDIKSGEELVIVHPERYDFINGGQYTLTVEVLTSNGEEDAILENNVATQAIEVLDGYVRKPILEVFTSSTCIPCASANPYIDDILSNYPERYSLLKYQMSWPGNGDPYYIAECGARGSYYGVNSVPSIYLNGDKSSDFSTVSLETELNKLSQFGIDLNAQLIGDSVFIDVELTSRVDYAAGLKCFTAVVENITHNNVASNGEVDFYNVAMKMVPSAAGEYIGAIQANEPVMYTYAESLKETHVEEITDLTVVVFVQDEETKEVLQSEMIAIPFSPAPPYVTFNIENDADNVSVDTVIIVTSDKALRMADNSAITNFENIINLKIDNESGIDVPYSAEINNENTQITIQPENTLELNTTYYISIEGVESLDDIALNKTEIRFTTGSATSVEENRNYSVKIWPNPARDQVNVDLSTISTITVFDILGNEHFNIKNVSGQVSVNISKLPKGLYLVHIQSKQYSQVIKLIRK